jgi:alkyl hydroperoxide reductase subunit AhpC
MHRLCCVLYVLCAAGALSAGDASLTLPHYSLPVGRQITYIIQSRVAGDAQYSKNGATWEFTVVGKNADGSSRVLMRLGDLYRAVDISPDGSMRAESDDFTSSVVRSDAMAVFPRLPVSDAQLKSGWSNRYESVLGSQSSVSFSVASRSADEWVINERSASGRTGSGLTIRFDTKAGIVSEIESGPAQAAGGKPNGSTRVTPLSDKNLPVETADRLGREYDVCVAAAAHYQDQVQAAEQAPSQAAAEKLLAKASTDLAAAAANLTDANIQRQSARNVTDGGFAEQVQRAVSARLTYCNKPAFDFSGVDLQGNQLKLSDYRGKVVVLDFWKVQALGSTQTLPQLRQVAKDCANLNVVVIGVNLDTDFGSVRMASGIAHQAGFETVHGLFVNENFGIQDFPAVVIVDKQGVTRFIQTGSYSKLRDVADAVARALSAPEGGEASILDPVK